MAWDFLQIQQDDTLTCNQKLNEIQDLIRNVKHPPPGSLYYISDIFEECVDQEHAECLKTAYLISEQHSLLASNDLGRGLKAIGEADIDVVNQFIKQKIQGRNIRSAHYLAPLIPHLYRGQESEMTSQMQDWYDMYTYFFFRALNTTSAVDHQSVNPPTIAAPTSLAFSRVSPSCSAICVAIS